jgi:hypothetical protein
MDGRGTVFTGKTGEATAMPHPSFFRHAKLATKPRTKK